MSLTAARALKEIGHGDARTGIGAGEAPQYAALARIIDSFHADLLRPLAQFEQRVFESLRLSRSTKRFRKDGDEEDDAPFETTIPMMDAIVAAAKDLFAELAGPDRTRYGFVHRDPEDDKPDGVLQQHEQQAFAVGVQRAGRLMQQATDVTVGRQSPAVEAMLNQAFDRLSQNGRLRLEGILDDVQGILVSGAANGLSPLAVARQLTRQFDAYKGWEFQRLARTEAAFASERGVRTQLKEFGVEKVEYLAGAGACPVCEELDGRIFAIDDEASLPPQHPQCLCTCAPVTEEESEETV